MSWKYLPVCNVIEYSYIYIRTTGKSNQYALVVVVIKKYFTFLEKYL